MAPRLICADCLRGFDFRRQKEMMYPTHLAIGSTYPPYLHWRRPRFFLARPTFRRPPTSEEEWRFGSLLRGRSLPFSDEWRRGVAYGSIWLPSVRAAAGAASFACDRSEETATAIVSMRAGATPRTCMANISIDPRGRWKVRGLTGIEISIGISNRPAATPCPGLFPVATHFMEGYGFPPTANGDRSNSEYGKYTYIPKESSLALRERPNYSETHQKGMGNPKPPFIQD